MEETGPRAPKEGASAMKEADQLETGKVSRPAHSLMTVGTVTGGLLPSPQPRVQMFYS